VNWQVRFLEVKVDGFESCEIFEISFPEEKVAQALIPGNAVIIERKYSRDNVNNYENNDPKTSLAKICLKPRFFHRFFVDA
jgi:hypothetical protein